MSVAERIEQAITPTVESLGFEVVRVRLTGGIIPPVVQLMLDRPEGGGILLDECAKVSRQVSMVLDVEDVIDGRYNLEVSSPGIDRPLVRLKDYLRYVGHEAKVELNIPRDERKRFRGIIREVRDENIVIVCDGEAIELPFADIGSAKLVLTDALLAAAKEQQ